MATDLKICHSSYQGSIPPDYHIYFFQGRPEAFDAEHYRLFSTPASPDNYILLDTQRFSSIEPMSFAQEVTIIVQDVATRRFLEISSRSSVLDNKTFRYEVSLVDPTLFSQELIIKITNLQTTFDNIRGCFIKKQNHVIENINPEETSPLPEARKGLYFQNWCNSIIWRARFFNSVYVDPVVTASNLEPDASLEASAAKASLITNRSFTVSFTELPEHRYLASFWEWLCSLFGLSVEPT